MIILTDSSNDSNLVERASVLVCEWKYLCESLNNWIAIAHTMMLLHVVLSSCGIVYIEISMHMLLLAIVCVTRIVLAKRKVVKLEIRTNHHDWLKVVSLSLDVFLQLLRYWKSSYIVCLLQNDRNIECGHWAMPSAAVCLKNIIQHWFNEYVLWLNCVTHQTPICQESATSTKARPNECMLLIFRHQNVVQIIIDGKVVMTNG